MAANPATQSQPPGPPEPDTPEPPAEDAKRIDELLRKISVALAQSDFEAAAAAAKEAAAAAKTKPSRERVERWAELITFAEGFAGYRDQALATVKAGAEYDVDGKKVGVVEIDDDKFIYRYAGKNKTVSRDRIPGAILLTIVTTWFDAKAANDLFIGAYHATKDEPDLDKARAAWQQAEAGGADASLLLPLLDDPILQASQ